MDLPLISIIVTTYNYAHTVGTAIDSALAQDYPNFEVVVVDNASTDDTPALLERYRDEPRLRSIRNPVNIGMVPNHNKGLTEARGTYVLFLSADDFLMPGHLTLSYRYLAAHPDVDVLYTTAYFVNSDGLFYAVRQMGGQPLIPYDGGRNEFAGLLTEGCYMCFPTMLTKRELYDRFGPLDEEIKAADFEIVIRWAANGVRFGYLPEATCAVRLHTNQQSSPQNYVADAGDIREFVYLAKKFAMPHYERLHGYEMSLSRMLWSRYQLGLSNGVTDADGALRAQLNECDALLAAVKKRNAEAPRRLRPTVIVLGSKSPAQMERTFRSLVAQTHEDWTAIVVEQLAHGYGPLAAFVDPRGRITSHRPLAELTETQAVLAALRIAPGDVFLVLRAGDEYLPNHLERVLTSMRDLHVEALRTSALLALDDAGPGAMYKAFPELGQQRLPWIAPCAPLEALAFTRVALDTAPLNEYLPVFAEWDFFLRVALAMPVGALDAPVIVHETAAARTLFDRYAQLPAIANHVHQTFRSEDPTVQAERQAYLKRLGDVLSGGPHGCTTPDAAVQLTGVASGGEFLAGFR